MIRTLDLVRNDYINEMAISGDGRRLEVLFWGEETLHFCDLATLKPVQTPIEAHNGVVYGIDTTADGNLISHATVSPCPI